MRHGTCFHRRLSTRHAGAAPHSAVAELEVVRRLSAFRMKRILQLLIRCIWLTLLLQVCGIILSWLAFNLVFSILDRHAFGLFSRMSFDLCLRAFLVRGILVAFPISIFISSRRSWFAPLVALIVAGVIFWILGLGPYAIQQGHWEMDNPRDRSVAIGGAVGYAIATLVIQRLILLRRSSTNTNQTVA